jgi:hypothetical protein
MNGQTKKKLTHLLRLIHEEKRKERKEQEITSAVYRERLKWEANSSLQTKGRGAAH